MSYYILPKHNYTFDINPTYQSDPLHVYISHSLHTYLCDSMQSINQLEQCALIDEQKHKDLSLSYKLINPYEFIFSNIPSQDSSISRLKISSNTFYILLELINSFNVLKYNCNIKAAHYGIDNASIECLNLIRCEYTDIHYTGKCENGAIDFFYFDINSTDILPESRVESTSDLIYGNINNYVRRLCSILMIILTNQSIDGSCIIQVDNLFYKPVLDILYILSGVYDKVVIIKPNTSNIISNTRYIVCKQYHLAGCNTHALQQLLNNSISTNIKSLINHELPVYFLNKIVDSNIIIGYQQIEAIDQLINILNSKYKHDKIEILKKNHIQKCMQWCEKYNIPYNKVVGKVNMFLKQEKNAGVDYFIGCPPGFEAEIPLLATVGPAEALPKLVTDFEK